MQLTSSILILAILPLSVIASFTNPFVVAIHGMLVDESVFDTLALEFKTAHQLEIFRSKSNGLDKMHRGIRILARDLADELMTELERRVLILRKKHDITRPTISMSIFAHSMGGLVARYFVAWFFGNGDDPVSLGVDAHDAQELNERRKELFYRTDIVPVGFYTVGSPHLGLDSLPHFLPDIARYAFSRAVEWWYTSATLPELLHMDPGLVLDKMTGPDFLDGIQKFRYRTLIANAQDSRVPLASALISPLHGFNTGVSRFDYGDRYTSIYHDGFSDEILRQFKSFDSVILKPITEKLLHAGSNDHPAQDKIGILLPGVSLGFYAHHAASLAPVFNRRLVLNFHVFEVRAAKLTHSATIGKKLDSVKMAGVQDRSIRRQRLLSVSLLAELVACDLARCTQEK